MGWNFFADRGGTFCDVIGISPQGQVFIYKLLSENPERYKDAVVQGIRDILSQAEVDIATVEIDAVKVGTTIATNALLERKGTPTVLLTTKGFGDALRIGYQNRPDIFALEIVLPEILYTRVIEVEERYDTQGNELIPINLPQVQQDLGAAYNAGIRSCAIAFLHSYNHPTHERLVAQIAREIGFTQVSVSHEVSLLIKFVSRGWTTVVDAYLSPILRDYVDRVRSELATLVQHGHLTVCPSGSPVPHRDGDRQDRDWTHRATADPCPQPPRLFFMKSDGGLVDAGFFRGVTSILSGPAGGIVGAVKTSQMAGFEKIIGFDMGGTSTDVSHFNGEYERTFETEVAGVKLRTPMMSIHTVAAGGGSILHFKGSYQVGPDSAGANPGPACYRRGGPLAITDCNVMLGKIQTQFFPSIFGVNGDLPLDRDTVVDQFTQLTQQIQGVTGDSRTPEQVAAGFIDIAVENMANAIKKISLQRGYDISNYTLCCFGGAGGQHACLIADKLGMQRIFIHPYAGVLSAYGIGMAEIRVSREMGVEKQLDDAFLPQLEQTLTSLIDRAQADLTRQNPENIEQTKISRKVHLKYEGTDTPLMVDVGTLEGMRQQFENFYQQQFGFLMPDRTIIVSLVSVELSCPTYTPHEPTLQRRDSQPPQPVATVPVFTADDWHDTPVYKRDDLQPGDCITGPALIIEATGTNVIEPGWQAGLTECNHLVLQQDSRMCSQRILESSSQGILHQDPVKLEIFKNLFQFIAEEMGISLQKTAASVNIRERLDFSCAIFDSNGHLVANAPHIPVHLGSMGDSVQSLIKAVGSNLKPGDVYLSNNPYNGGTHLPDVTVITPVFDGNRIIFYVASRGHQADIGGITPGSMPPHSTTIQEEGILIDNFKLVGQGHFRERELRELLLDNPYPVRNLEQNLADFKAQIAANVKGLQELQKMVSQYGLETVQAYMGFVQDNAEEAVRRAIDVLNDGEFTYLMDNGGVIQVSVKIDRNSRSARIDFTGTSAQLNNNFNAPSAIVKAAVLYVFRTLVDENIPLNAGCLRPLDIIIPEGSLLNPQYPAAVVAGNVETSQAICNALYGALGVMAASGGTMNNFTFGNEQYQFYTTLAGGSGAGFRFNGTSAVQTAMTNSRLTDPEVLESRFPVLLENFSIRPDSGGDGQYKGGNGVIYRMRFREPMTAGILSSSRIISPFGLQGGESGKVGHNYVQRSDGTIEELDSTATVDMAVGDVFVVETPGGGGYGYIS